MLSKVIKGWNCMQLLLLILVFIPVLTGCSDDEMGYTIPDDYDSWQRLNDIELNYPIPGHESNYRIIYINDIGTGGFTAEQGGYPDGTIIVKAVYEGLEPEPGAKPVMLTGMIKDPDHENARGGWVWVMKDVSAASAENERPLNVVMEAFCFTCHREANKPHPYADGNPSAEFRDFVFFSRE